MNLGLLYLCAFTGLIVVVGSLLLIWTGRIVIDKDGGAVSEVQLPFGFRLHTQLPVVIMFFFGAFLLALPVILVRKSLEAVPTLTLTGTITPPQSSQNFRAYVVASDCDATSEVVLQVPLVPTTSYRVFYFNGSTRIFDEFIDWSRVKDGRYQLKKFTPPVLAADSQRISESLVSKESPDVLKDFK